MSRTGDRRIVGAERCYMPARARTRGPTRPNEPPRRPLPSTHTGCWAHTRNPPSPHMARRRTQSPAGNGPPVKAHKQAITATHRDPPRRLAAVRSPGTARHASRATAPSTRTAKEARDWAIGGRHGEIRARMCGLQHLPHDPQIPDQRFTVLKARSRKHPGLAKRLNCFHATKDTQASRATPAPLGIACKRA